MYSRILLDLDGTVLDFCQTERHAFFSTMQEIGAPSSEQAFRRYHAINAALWAALERGEISHAALRPLRFQRLLEPAGVWDWDAVNTVFVSHLAQAGIPFPGAKELLCALHRQYRICVVTNGLRKSQASRLVRSGLSPYIDCMLTSEEVGAPKPSPAIFEAAMEREGVWDPGQYLMIGDSLTADILGANRAGIDSMWYAPDGQALLPGILPTCTVRSYDEIARILLKKAVDSEG